MNKLVKLFFSYGITSVFIVVLFRQLDFHYLIFSLKHVGLKDWLGAFFFLFLAYLLRGLRWGLMLNMLGSKVALLKSQHIFWLGMAINNVLPFRMGDVYRVFALRGYTTLSAVSILSSLILERLFDLLILLGLFIFTLPFVKVHIIPPSFIQLLQVLILFCAIILMGLFILPGAIKRFLNFLSLKYAHQSRLLNLILQQSECFIDAILLLQTFSSTCILLIVCLLAWFSEGLVFLFAAQGVNAHQGLVGSLFASSIGALSTLIPSAPGYVGTFDYFTMLGFRAFGSTMDTATAAALLSHLILWLPVTLYGLIYYLFRYIFPVKSLKIFQDLDTQEKAKTT